MTEIKTEIPIKVEDFRQDSFLDWVAQNIGLEPAVKICRQWSGDRPHIDKFGAVINRASVRIDREKKRRTKPTL